MTMQSLVRDALRIHHEDQQSRPTVKLAAQKLMHTAIEYDRAVAKKQKKTRDAWVRPVPKSRAGHAARNSLLIAIRRHHPVLDCYRTYTTVYKDGSFRVKLYGQDAEPKNLVRDLQSDGFVDIAITRDPGGRSPCAVTIRARHPITAVLS